MVSYCTEVRLSTFLKKIFLRKNLNHAYKDIFKHVIGTTLTLQREPENAKDPSADALVEHTGSIVGHIPLALSRIVSSFLKRADHKATTENCGKLINRGSGLRLELPVICKIYGGRKYLDRLNELIHDSDTAKRALRAKDEGILTDGQKKRKSTKKTKTLSKSRKEITLICVQIFQDAARCPP